MITEDYVSFETAKLLKEKGFDEPCLSFFWTEDTGSDVEYCDRPFTNKQLYSGQILRPTLQMAMKWLREMHNKHCDVGYDIDLEWFFQIIDLKETVDYDYLETKYYHPENGTGFKSYEQACEAAIKYCLENLI